MFRTIIFVTSLALSSSSVLAVTANQIFADNQVVIGLSAGPTWSTGNNTQTFNLEPDVVKTYTGDNKNSSFPTAELFIGLQKSWFASAIKQSFLGQLGISIVGAGNTKLSGDIWDDADPMFNNSSYTYKVNHTHVALKGRLVGDCNYLFEPYISASVGVGFNHAYDFAITPTIAEEVAAPPFESNTTTAFSYTLGVGLQTSLTPQLQAAIGYEFADWGQINLSRAQGQTVNQGLSLNHLYANQLQLSLFYIV